MSNFGFVYILTNEYMPDVFKVGCTERSPHARAAELSQPTGVPAPFKVLCYIEVEDFQAVEKRLHKWLGDLRISPNREFFYTGLAEAVRWMWWFPDRVSFCEPLSPFDPNMFQTESCFEHVDYGGHYQSPNPWEPEKAPEPSAEVIADQAIKTAKEFE